MIIFGWRGVTFKSGGGTFHCPQCGPDQDYLLRSVRQFFTLYFIPVIPLNKLGEYVECQSCNGKFDPRVIDYDPAEEHARLEAEFVEHVKRIMVLTALGDDDVDDFERVVIQDVYRELSNGSELTDSQLDHDIEQARRAGTEPASYAKGRLTDLTEHGKENVVRAALRVTSADGPLDEYGIDRVREIAEAIGMSSAHFRGVVAEIEESA